MVAVHGPSERLECLQSGKCTNFLFKTNMLRKCFLLVKDLCLIGWLRNLFLSVFEQLYVDGGRPGNKVIDLPS